MRSSREDCRLSIAIPAKNERAKIVRALRAFTEQRNHDGSLLDPKTFEVLILANDCNDDTEGVSLAYAAQRCEYAFHVVSGNLPPNTAHVGTARRIALDLAFERQRSIRGAAGIIATTDADSVVDQYWIASTLAELTRADAVAGYVEISEFERQGMQVPLRVLYDRECAYRRAIGEVEARFDPRPFDPPRRHDAFVGASFAVRVETYAAAGGLPPLRKLEDLAFERALRRIDARVRHSYDVRVATSARANARVDGGFGSFIDDLRTRGSRHESFPVESGTRRVLRAKARAHLRRSWMDSTDTEALSATAEAYGITLDALRMLIEPLSPFGHTLDRIDAQGIAFEALPDEPVEIALATLRAAVREPVLSGVVSKRSVSV
jgi:glycosyltransferase involved in cell wall biosynthesis